MATTNAATIQPLPYWEVLDDNGLPAAGAKIYAYYVTSSTPRDTYTTYIGDTPAAWPIICDSAGRATVFLGSGLYKFIVTDSLDNVIETVDGVGGSGNSIVVNTVKGTSNSIESLAPGVVSNATALGYSIVGDNGGGQFYWGPNVVSGIDGGSIVAPLNPDVLNPGSWIRTFNNGQPVSLLIWGAVTQTTGDAAFVSALAYCKANSVALLIPKGTYYITSDPSFGQVPVVMDPFGAIGWSNAISPSIIPVIGRDDNSQHFFVSVTAPNFVAGTEARPEWFADSSAVDFSDGIQFGLDSVSTNGGVLRIPDGTYTINNQLVMKSNVQVIGQGPGSLIKPAVSFAGSYLLAGQADNIGIKNCNFVGLGGTSCYGVNVAGANVAIENNQFLLLPTALTVDGTSSNVLVRNNYFKDCTGSMLINAGNVDVIENTMITRDNVQDVVWLGNSVTNFPGYIRFNNNHIETPSTGSHAIYVLANTSPDGFYEIKNNRIHNASTTSSILIDAVQKPIYLDGNALDSSNATGIGIKESSALATTHYGPGNILVDYSNEYSPSTPRFIDIGYDLSVEINGSTEFRNSVTIGDNLFVAGNETVYGDVKVDGTGSFSAIDTTNLSVKYFVFGSEQVAIQAARTFPVIIGTDWDHSNAPLDYRSFTSVNGDQTGSINRAKIFNITYQEFFNLISYNIPYTLVDASKVDAFTAPFQSFRIYPHLTSTSDSTITMVGGGTYTFLTQPNLQVSTGEHVNIVCTSQTSSYFSPASVMSYDSLSGTLVVDATSHNNITASAWNLYYRNFPAEWPTNSVAQAQVIQESGDGARAGDLRTYPGIIQMQPTVWRPGISYGYWGGATGQPVDNEYTQVWNEPTSYEVHGLGNQDATCGQTVTIMVPSI